MVSRVSSGMRGRSSRPRNFCRVDAVPVEQLAVVRHVFVRVTHDGAQAFVLPVAHALRVPPLALLEQLLEFGKPAAVSLASRGAR